MKKFLFCILMLMLSIVLAACSNDDENSGGGKRDISNVKKALYGHWKNTNDTHYYISDGEMLTKDEDGAEEYSYKVEEHDEVRNLIVMKLERPDGSGRVTEITYKNDERKELDATTEASTIEFADSEDSDTDPELEEFVESTIKEQVSGMVVEEEWVYIDGKTKP